NALIPLTVQPLSTSSAPRAYPTIHPYIFCITQIAGSITIMHLSLILLETTAANLRTVALIIFTVIVNTTYHFFNAVLRQLRIDDFCRGAAKEGYYFHVCFDLFHPSFEILHGTKDIAASRRPFVWYAGATLVAMLLTMLVRVQIRRKGARREEEALMERRVDVMQIIR
ncbi:hypothetical protein PFISCL1PPCAC_384, partial [Pristionchus fissidentatus]